jgi:hypothetical protein
MGHYWWRQRGYSRSQSPPPGNGSVDVHQRCGTGQRSGIEIRIKRDGLSTDCCKRRAFDLGRLPNNAGDRDIAHADDRVLSVINGLPGGYRCADTWGANGCFRASRSLSCNQPCSDRNQVGVAA